MNAIKFRAWDKTSKSMIDDYAHTGQYGELYTTTFHSSAYGDTCPDLVLLQFTGLLDKNGIEIYEGDILKDDYDRVLLVEWFKCGYALKAITETNFIRAHNITQWFEGYSPSPEIIGNKFQNPELLKEATT